LWFFDNFCVYGKAKITNRPLYFCKKEDCIGRCEYRLSTKKLVENTKKLGIALKK
jgi:hypothetical protein